MQQPVSNHPRSVLSALLLLIFMSMPFTSLWASAVSIQFSAEEIEREGIRLQQVNGTLMGRELNLKIDQLSLDSQAGVSASGIRLQCPELGNEELGWCPGGAWRLRLHSADASWQQDLHGLLKTLQWNTANRQGASSLLTGSFVARLTYSELDSGTEMRLEWSKQPLHDLPFRELLPEQLSWVKSGQSDAVFTLLSVPVPATASTSVETTAAESNSTISLRYELGLKDISLDSPEGRFAAEGLDMRMKGDWQPGATQKWSLDAKFLAGEVLADNFYTSFESHALMMNAQLELKGEKLVVKELRLFDDGALQLQASAALSLDKPVESLKYQVENLQMQFPQAYLRYLEPVLAARTLDKLTVTGSFSWAGSGKGNDFPSGTLVFDDLSVVDHAESRFAFTGMSARIMVGGSEGVSDFSWRGLLLGRINLGAGNIEINTAPGLFELAKPIRLAVLGGAFEIDEFSLQLPVADTDSEPVVKFNASLNDMDMEQLTQALGWPSFAGTVSGRIPGASFHEGVLTVDGLLSFDAFDGQIQLSDLRVERLFGVLPSLAADLKVDNLDLQKLTSAFSFGRIAGRLDGYVNHLRMLDWSPVSFDAWFGTPERQSDSNQISRQAVNSLTSIGGGGATAALTGPLMKMFSNFSYRRLGMGCKLENYVCDIRGLEDETDSVVIMEGSGIPKLMIKVFNRRMDFPQLLANLEAASEGEDIRIGNR